jgi:formyltetrahydrofolate hydrolase
VAAIISNWPDHSNAADHFGVPAYELLVSAETNDVHEAELLDVLARHRVDLGVSARYI